MEMKKDMPVLRFESQKAWRDWLNEHHEDAHGVWIKIAKKATGIPTVTHSEALDEALCYGWIDGQRLGFDDTFFLQKFTPRRKQSTWSKINIGKVTVLIEAGKMTPAGFAQIEAAKRDGRWDRAYSSQRTIVVHPDFQAALDVHLKAKEALVQLSSANRYSFLWRVETAKTAETRKARIEKFIDMLEKGETFH